MQLKFFDRSNLIYVEVLLNAHLSYGCVPVWMPNKFRDESVPDIYPEIMSTTDLYKLLEYCIWFINERKVYLSTCQFRYRANTSTLLETLVLEEKLHRYVRYHKKKINACFIDMRRAFERVNLELLLRKKKRQRHSRLHNKLTWVHLFWNLYCCRLL